MNWVAWLEWTRQRSGVMLFHVFLILVSDTIFAPLTGAFMLKLKPRIPFVTYIGMLLVGLGMRRIFEFVASIDGPRDVVYSNWYGWWHWIGEGFEFIPVLMLCCFILFGERDTSRKKKLHVHVAEAEIE